ncbi:Rieske (2Fe-2S) domain protein [Rhizorhabdus wittichii RW1]|uniref:Rieske (2Fe-2S) domain protein n=1 Tax=Rhizorhabdus wittichii (strain DSM 6014 / CCUG 31198 / JCM 15750 / NBRC 105917 / EY 4224 / RW1) TaxID=392499 RepID=A0A9J9LD96_RHIWR|nr:Rieske (2Fe-2S) domain protein [Rhizorhabdus wittichii RW1]
MTAFDFVDGEELGRLVRPDRIHARVYTDPALFELEQQNLFGRAWMIVGHESQVPTPGAFVTANLGTLPVIVTRSSDDAIHVLENRCPHKGAAICTVPSGKLKRLQCPYHGWAFRLDGSLLALPERQEYDAGIDTAGLGLTPVAKVELYRGFIFANTDPNAPPLATFLGPMADTIDNLVDRAPEGRVEIYGSPVRYVYRGNWKFVVENFNDAHHAAMTHASAVSAVRSIEARVGSDKLSEMLRIAAANGKPMSVWQSSPLYTVDYGHSYFGTHFAIPYEDDVMAKYFPMLVDAHGEAKARDVLNFDQHLMILYPSSSWQTRYQSLRVVRPLAVDRTEVIGYVFRLVGAPEETLDEAVRLSSGFTGFNIVTQDDIEVFESCQEAMTAGRIEWNFIGRGAADTGVPQARKTRHVGTSEAYIRGQMAAWAGFMGGMI